MILALASTCNRDLAPWYIISYPTDVGYLHALLRALVPVTNGPAPEVNDMNHAVLLFLLEREVGRSPHTWTDNLA